MRINLSGICFADLPHIRNEWRDGEAGELMPSGALVKMMGEAGIVVRETGEEWDSDGHPAYSVRMGSMHVGYIPLETTIALEIGKARDGWRKVWKDGYDGLTPAQLREESKRLIESGEDATMHDWEFVGTETTKPMLRWLTDKKEAVIAIRDHLYTEMERNHRTPECRITASYFNEVTKKVTSEEVGEICSVQASFDIGW